jgi:hypothetical protein
VAVTRTNPIGGQQSLVVGTSRYGDGVLWRGRDLTGWPSRRARALTASARIRTTMSSSSQICLRALVDYDAGAGADRCTYVSGAAGDKGTVTVSIALDNARDISRVRLGVFQEGDAALSGVMLDDASVAVEGLTAP